MDQELQQKFAELEAKVDATYKSSERMRKAFMWTIWITIALIVLPLIGLAFVIPMYINSLPNLSSMGL